MMFWKRQKKKNLAITRNWRCGGEVDYKGEQGEFEDNRGILQWHIFVKSQNLTLKRVHF